MDKWKRAFFKKWRRKLRLEDWDITFKEVRVFPRKTVLGTTSDLIMEDLTATIKVRQSLPATLWKLTVVHELLHVRFPKCSFQWDTGSLGDHDMEVGIDMTARALLNMKRVR